MKLAHPLVITAFDRDRLEQLLDDPAIRDGIEPTRFLALEAELARATIVASDAVPANVVTMNSQVVLLDRSNGEELRVTMVFPEQADPAESRISVLSPVGLALLGAREGEQLTWATPGNLRRLHVTRIVYQPEAAGHFDR